MSALVDEFLRARFFEARNEYEEQWSAAAEGDSLRIRRLRGVDGATWDLSLRLGAWSKTVRLYLGYPGDLAALRDRIEEIAGPQSWPAR